MPKYGGKQRTKAIDVEREKERKREKRERKQWPATPATATMGGTCKPPGPIFR